MTLNLRHDAFCNDVNLIGRVVGIKMNDGMFYEGSVVAINLGYPSATGGLVITSITVSLTPGRIADVWKNPVRLLMINVADMQLVQSTVKAALLTDSDMRRLRGAAFESRDLEPIDPSWLPAGDSMSDIDALEGPNANKKDWDQFRANEELFGVSSSSFDENLYTTRLNMSTFTETGANGCAFGPGNLTGEVRQCPCRNRAWARCMRFVAILHHFQPCSCCCSVFLWCRWI
jgi:hypothetical protein